MKIPHGVELKQFTRTSTQKAIETILHTEMRLSEAEITALKESKACFVFLWDGYQKLAGGGFFNPYRGNGLSQWSAQTKVIIEKIGALPSATQWFLLREIRNAFMHDYPEESEQRAHAINEAYQHAEELILIYKNLSQFIKQYS